MYENTTSLNSVKSSAFLNRCLTNIFLFNTTIQCFRDTNKRKGTLSYSFKTNNAERTFHLAWVMLDISH